MNKKIEKQLTYKYVSNKLKKRNYRKNSIVIINNALKKYNMNYSTFINKLKINNIILNRSILALIAKKEFKTFKSIIINL